MISMRLGDGTTARRRNLLHFPDSRRAILRRRNDLLSVGTEPGRRHDAAGFRELRERFAALNIPYAYPATLRCRYDWRRHNVAIFCKIGQQVPSARIPYPGRTVLRFGDESLAIRTEPD